METLQKQGGAITENIATTRGNTAYLPVSPIRWRNANAGPTNNTGDVDFWLND